MSIRICEVGERERAIKQVTQCTTSTALNILFSDRGRISSVGSTLDCRAGGRGFDSWERNDAQGLRITENEGTYFALQTA